MKSEGITTSRNSASHATASQPLSQPEAQVDVKASARTDASREQVVARSRLVAAVVGFGFLRAWLGWALGTLRGAFPEAMAFGLQAKLTFDLGEIAGAAICLVVAYRYANLWERRPFTHASSAMALAGTAAVLAATAGLELPRGPMSLVILLCGAAYIVVLMMWVERLGFDSPVHVMVVCVASYAIGSALWFYVYAMPAVLSSVTALLLLGASLGLLVFYRATEGAAAPALQRPTNMRRYHKVYAWVWVFALAYGVGVSFTGMGYASGAVKLGTLLPLLLAIPYAVKRDRFDFSLVYRMSFLIMIAGFAVAIANAGNITLMQVLFSASQALVMTIAMTFACGIARLNRASAAIPYGIVSIGWYLSAIPARYLSAWVIDEVELTVAQDLLIVVTAIALLSVASFFLFREVDFAEQWKDICADLGHDELVRACDALAVRGGLSKREVSVLSMLVQGTTQAEISEQLFIAPGTVRAHVNHIYEKLGVHSMGDLGELYERELRGR